MSLRPLNLMRAHSTCSPLHLRHGFLSRFLSFMFCILWLVPCCSFSQLLSLSFSTVCLRKLLKVTLDHLPCQRPFLQTLQRRQSLALSACLIWCQIPLFSACSACAAIDSAIFQQSLSYQATLSMNFRGGFLASNVSTHAQRSSAKSLGCAFSFAIIGFEFSILFSRAHVTIRFSLSLNLSLRNFLAL